MSQQPSRLNGMQSFIVVWLGQLVSLFGTATTRFALLIWAYDQTSEATTLALLGFFSFITYVLVSPVAGVLIDRLDRRRVMILADLGAGLMTIAMLLLYTTGNLQIWHLYVAEGLTGAFEAFQIPSYIAATTLLVPKERHARASGMRSLAVHASQMFAPILAGLMLNAIDIDGVMLVDGITFLFAMGTLLIVRFPRPAASAEGKALHGEGVRRQMGFGFRYIFQRKGLLWLLFMFTLMNFIGALTWFSILPAMVLARTGSDELSLASVQSALGIGGVLGGLAVSAWGGPKRRIHSILMGAAISFLTGDFVLAIGSGLPVWMAGAFTGAFFIPFITSADSAIWQAKVPPDVQGRVFSAREMLRMAAFPLGFLIAGPLADRVFEPAMMPGGSLASVFGGLVGTGAGAGMALMFVCTSLMGMTLSLSGYLFPAVRNVERDLPDHDAAAVYVATEPARVDAALL